MRIYCITNKETYDLEIKKNGENHLPCPACADLHPKNTKKRCFSWNQQKETGFCHRCDSKFVKYKPMEVREKKEYKVPEPKNDTQLSEEHLKDFYGRKITQEALIKMGVYSAEEWMPQAGKKVPVICFPYHRGGKLVNVKYRGPNKVFKLVPNAELILMNIDVIKEHKTIAIVEGEYDLLSFITVGISNVVSVPNGASKNLDYLDSCIEEFDKIETIYLAVDNDEKGRALLKELARRFGPERCMIVDFEDCKDANEYLVKYGGLELRKVIQNATQYPVDGVFTVQKLAEPVHDLFVKGPQPGKVTGVKSLDELITWETGRLTVVTGIPSHGKSEFVDFVIVLLNLLHGWKCAFFSPENHPIEYHIAKLAEKFLGQRFSAEYVSEPRYIQVVDFLNDNYFFISPEENFTVDSILEKARYLVKTRGIRILVIDPYNRMDHQIPKGYTETQYISEFLDKLTNFGRINDVLIFLVAHPVKMPKEHNGRYMVPNLYSINGSSNFYNKADFGLTVYRDQDERGLTSSVKIYVQKVKFRHFGSGGMAEFVFNGRNGRYESPSTDIHAYTANPNWLDHKPQHKLVLSENGIDDSKGDLPF